MSQIVTNSSISIPAHINEQTIQTIMDDEEEQRLSILRKQFTLTKSQLLQIVYYEDKFLEKLQQLNELGCKAMQQGELFSEAIVYLICAESILQYAASCGKTIDRNVIITTLQNEACAYHRMWQLQKSTNYIEAIIYNINSFLDSEKHRVTFQQSALEDNSLQNIKTSIYIKNKLQLFVYHLQYCAVSSQNQCHKAALMSAEKALKLIKQICEQEYKLQRVGRKSSMLQNCDQEHAQMLLQLCNIRDHFIIPSNKMVTTTTTGSHNYKQLKPKQRQTPNSHYHYQQPSTAQRQHLDNTIQKLLNKATRVHPKYQEKVVKLQQQGQIMQRHGKISAQLGNYSIGLVMQINPKKIQIGSQKLTLDLKDQFQYINKIYKAIYISICHFTIATELRLISSEQHPLDPQMRKSSQQFKLSQLHHLVSIITAATYIPCQTVYYEHILNNFRNHYSVDLSLFSDKINSNNDYPLSKKQVENDNDDEEEDLIHLQTSSLNLRKDTNQSIQSNQLKPTYNQNQSKTTHVIANPNHQEININMQLVGSYGPQMFAKVKNKHHSKTKIVSNKINGNQQLLNGKKSQNNKPKSQHKSQSKSKQKLVNNGLNKKSNMKQSSKSKKKSSRKHQNQHIKSPQIHNKKVEIKTVKKISNMKQTKNSQVKRTTKSKTKSRKKLSKSKPSLQDSKQKPKLSKNSQRNIILTSSSTKNFLPPSVHSLKSLDRGKQKKSIEKKSMQKKCHQQKQKQRQKYCQTLENTQKTKTLSNNVYIQRSNNTNTNHHQSNNKQKLAMRKYVNHPTSIMMNSVSNSVGNSQKNICIKKSRSPPIIVQSSERLNRQTNKATQ